MSNSYFSKSKRISGAKATIYGSELKRLARTQNGKLETEFVVTKARSEVSPLHDAFEWDDAAAAHQHRLKQARTLIRDIVEVQIVPSPLGQEERVIHQFYSIKENEEQFYVELATAVATPDYTMQIIDKLLNKIRETTSLLETFRDELSRR